MNSTVHCARCRRAGTLTEGTFAPAHWRYVTDRTGGDPVYVCSNDCVLAVNDELAAKGLPRWRWFSEDGPEPRASSALELALWLASAEEAFTRAYVALRADAPGARERWRVTKKELESAFTICVGILMHRAVLSSWC